MTLFFAFSVSIVFIVIITILLNYTYKQTNFYKNQFIDTEKFTESNQLSIPHNLEVVNIGSNHPKFAFDYTESGLLGMNWAIGPQSFEYDFRVLKKVHTFLKEKAFVIIPVCPFSFFLYRFPYDSVNYKYYNFLDSEMINNYSSRTKKLYIDYPVLTAKRNLLRLIKDAPADIRLHIDANLMSNAKLKEDAHKWINGWLKQFSLESLENISLSTENRDNIEKNIALLNEMIDFCFERNYRPVIMTLPVTKELCNLFPQSFIDNHILANIKQANTQRVPVFNYLKDERFVSPDLYFNSFFFNANGRRIFTKTVVNDLKML
jgi:hypothetical protein